MIADGGEFIFRVLFAGDDARLRREVEDVVAAIRGARVELIGRATMCGALEAITSDPFDVCLAGQSLGETSGVDFIRAACAGSAKAPIIFLSETGDPAANAEAMEAGGADYLVRSDISVSLMERSLRYVIERRHLQEELGILLEAAGESAKVKAEFMANMTHEIKTPLNAVIGMIDLVLDSDLSHQQHENLMLARFSADSLLSLMTNIIDFSSMESGKLLLRNRTFPLRQTVLKAVLPLHVAAERKGLRLTSNIADNLPDLFFGDPERLTQILGHLLSNAVKFTEQGEISLCVRAEPDEAGGVLRWQVSDTGPGIPRGRIGHIFQIFTQVDGSSTRKHGGVGLGLSIVRNLVTMLGGRIWVESEPGKGTSFHFITRFTLAAGSTPRAMPEAEPAEAPRPVAARGAVKVIAAEDSIVNQLLLTEILQRAGYDVTVVSDGRKVVEAVASEEYAVVLMDLQMPVMDGYEATRAIRARERELGSHVPIIALTGSEYIQDRVRCEEAGMDDYLTKPLNERELRAALEKYLPFAPLPQRPVVDPSIPEGLGRHIDVEGVLDSLGGNTSLFFSVIDYFLEEGPLQLDTLRRGLAEMDERLIEQSAHKVKGMSANIGAKAVADEALRIQLAVRKGDHEQARGLAENIGRMIAALEEEVRPGRNNSLKEKE